MMCTIQHFIYERFCIIFVADEALAIFIHHEMVVRFENFSCFFSISLEISRWRNIHPLIQNGKFSF